MKTRFILSLMLLLALLLGACASQPTQPPAGQPPAAGGQLTPAVAAAPDTDQEQGTVVGEGPNGEENEDEVFSVPINPNAHPELVKPGPETIGAPLLPPDSNPAPNSPAAAGTFTIYQDTTLLAADFPGTWSVAEPSIAPNGRMIYTSGNKYDGVSGDYGQNFTYIDPFTIWAPPTPSTQFCCDQILVHDRTHNMTLWLMQYHTQDPGVSGPNVIRLSVAHGQKETFDGTWKTYDIRPQNLPEFSGSQNWWWDYPDMALSDNYLYITINPNIHIDSGQQRAVIFRLPLSTLSAGDPLPMPWPYYVTPTDVYGFARPTQGATSTMYFGQIKDSSTVRLYTWPEVLSAPLYIDYSVNGWYPSNALTYCADGTNWLAYGLMPVQAAWVAKGKIGFMWNSAQGGSFPYPNVRYVRINESNLTTYDQGQIYNDNFAFGFPSVNVNDRGDIAGTIGSGCGLVTDRTVELRAWISDSYNSNAMQPLENKFVAVGSNGGGNRWGDYYTTRRDTPYGNTWWGTGIVMNGGSTSANTNVHLVWFGRGADTPPASNTIYSDAGNGTAYQDGTSGHGFSKAGDGCYAAVPGDTVILKVGTYNEAGLLVTRPCFLDSQGGSAVVH